MRPKLFINSSVNLFHIVDYLSLWDQFIDEDIYTVYKKQYSITENDKKLLSEYKILRARLSWSEESKLFEYFRAYSIAELATQSYDLMKPEYKRIVEIVSDFAGKPELVQDIERATSLIERERATFESEIEKCFNLIGFEKLRSIFRPLETLKPIPIYILYTPASKSIIGGANGGSIYTEVFVDLEQSKIDRRDIEITIETLLHEYAHISLNPSKILVEEFNEDGFYDKVVEKVYPDTLSALLEEVLVHAFIDTLIFKADPFQKLSKYQSRKGSEDSAAIWGGVVALIEILQRITDREDDASVKMLLGEVNTRFREDIKLRAS